MSVNLHLSIVVRGYDPGRAGAIRQAVRDLIERKELEKYLPPLAEATDGGERVLSARSDPETPVIVSRAYKWAPAFRDELHAAVISANGRACVAVFDWEDADDDEDENLPDYDSG